MNNYKAYDEDSLLLKIWGDIVGSVTTKRSGLQKTLLAVINNPAKDAKARYADFEQLRRALISNKLNEKAKSHLNFRERIFWGPRFNWLPKIFSGSAGSKLRQALVQEIRFDKVITRQDYEHIQKKSKPAHINDHFINEFIAFKQELNKPESMEGLVKSLQGFKEHLSLDLYEQLTEKLYALDLNQALNHVYKHYRENSSKISPLKSPEHNYMELDFLAKALVKKYINFSLGINFVCNSAAQLLTMVEVNESLTLPNALPAGSGMPLTSLISAQSGCRNALFEHVNRQLIERLTILYLQTHDDISWKNAGLGRETLNTLLRFQNKPEVNTCSNLDFCHLENLVERLGCPEHPHVDIEVIVRRLLLNAGFYLPDNRELFINEFIRPLRAETVLNHADLLWIKSRVVGLNPNLAPEIERYFFNIKLHDSFPPKVTVLTKDLFNELSMACAKAKYASQQSSDKEENDAITTALSLVHTLITQALDLKSIERLINHVAGLSYALSPQLNEQVIEQIRQLHKQALLMSEQPAPEPANKQALQNAKELFTEITNHSHNLRAKDPVKTFRDEQNYIQQMRNSFAGFMQNGQNLSSAHAFLEALKIDSYLTDKEYKGYLDQIKKEKIVHKSTACKSGFWHKIIAKVGCDPQKPHNNPINTLR